MMIRNLFIVLFLLVLTQISFCVTNNFTVSVISKMDVLYDEGLNHYRGLGMPTNHTLALQCFMAAGKLGHTDACHKVGWIYNNSSTVSQDVDKAILWYGKASEMGLPKSMNNLGNIYQYKKKYRDYQKAREWYSKADDKNYLSATYQLGVLASKGRGMKSDQKLAEKYYLSAAKKGYAPAQAEMGFRNQERIFGKDYKKAMEWYQKAAAQTNARGIYGVGLMYYRGEAGVEIDYDKAIHYFLLAKKHKSPVADYNLVLCYQKKSETNKAFKLCSKIATQNDVSAQAKLGYFYKKGYGTTQNLEKAFYWYSQAAKKGNPYGLYGAGTFYEAGTLCDTNLFKAYSYYFRAALKEHKLAIEKVGWIVMFFTGIICFGVCFPGFVIVIFYGIFTRKSYAKRKTWTIPDAVILILCMIAFQIIFSGFYLASTKICDNQMQFSIILGIAAAGNSLVVFLAIYFSKLRKWLTSFQLCFNKIKVGRILKWIALSLAVVFLFNILYALTLNFFGIEVPPDNFEELMPDKFTPSLLLWTYLTVTIIVPITEEIIFRGILYKAFRQRWSVRLSIIISSAIFALIHMEFYRFIPLMFIGAVAAYLLEKTKSIYIPIIFHAAINAMSISLLIMMKKFGYV